MSKYLQLGSPDNRTGLGVARGLDVVRGLDVAKDVESVMRYQSFNQIRVLGLVCLCFTLGACASIVRPNYSQVLAELRPGDYRLDPEHAYVTFRVDHLGLSKIVGRFNVVAGSLDFDPDNIEQMALQGIIESSSIDVNNEGLEDQLQDSSWFASEQYPQITFTSTSVSQSTEDGALLITGDLNLKGVSKPITLQAQFNGGADNILTGKYTLGFTATTTIQRSDFGMKAFAALIGNEVSVELHGEFQQE